MSEGKIGLSAQEQLDGVKALLAQVNAALDAGPAQHNPQRLAQLKQEQGVLMAVATTLGWLARNREGCIQFLTTRFPFEAD